MNWIALFFALELGLVPQAGVLMYEPVETFDVEWAFYTELQAEILVFNMLFVGGGVKTYVTPGNSGYTFAPNTSVYDFGTGLRFKDTDFPVLLIQSLELGWRHRCFHPTIAYLPIFGQEIKGMEGSYDEVYIRVQVRTSK